MAASLKSPFSVAVRASILYERHVVQLIFPLNSIRQIKKKESVNLCNPFHQIPLRKNVQFSKTLNKQGFSFPANNGEISYYCSINKVNWKNES